MSRDNHTFDHVTPQTEEEMIDALEKSIEIAKARKGLEMATVESIAGSGQQ